MKKICLNCEFCDVAFPDIDIRDLKDDYLICLKSNKKVEDDNTCKEWKKSKSREDDLRCGC